MSTSGDSLNTIPGTLSIGKIAATGTPSASNYLRGDGIWDGISTTDISATGTPSALTVLRGDGVWAAGYHRSLSSSYISATGTSGTDDTLEILLSAHIAANTLTREGDRLEIRCVWAGTTGTAIAGHVTVNDVLVSTTTDSGGTSFQFNHVCLHYIDSTHANVIEDQGGVPLGLTTMNLAGFDWTIEQDILFRQSKAANNHIVLYGVLLDIKPMTA